MEFDIKRELIDFAKKYGLQFEYQEFYHCYGCNGTVFTYSVFNETGCFTIHELIQRCEIDFYFCKKFTTDLYCLCEKNVNIFDYEKQIWVAKEKQWGIFHKFFYWSNKRILKTLLEVMECSIKHRGDCFGVKIE